VPEKSALAPFKAKLGKIPDQQIADLANVSRTLVVNYRKKLGIPPYQGHKAAAPSAPAKATDDRPFRGRRSALDTYIDRLGRVPDAEIARLAGVTAENVRTYRHRRDIPATWQLADAPAAAASAAQPVSAKAPKAPPPRRDAPFKAPARTSAPPRPVSPPAAVPAAPAAAVQLASPAVSNIAYLVTVDTDEGPRSYALIAGDIALAAAEASVRVAARHPGGAIRSIQRVADMFPAE